MWHIPTPPSPFLPPFLPLGFQSSSPCTRLGGGFLVTKDNSYGQPSWRELLV